MLPAVLRAGETIVIDASSLSGGSVAPGQSDVLLLKAAVTGADDTGGIISALRFTFTGTSAGDVASLQLYVDDDGDWGTSSDRALLANGAFSGNAAVLYGFSVEFSSTSTRYLLLTAGIAAHAGEGNRINGEITDSGDITASGPLSGHFPLASLSSHAFSVDVSATALQLGSIPSSVTAGQTVTFSVSCVDANGNVDKNYSGSSLSVGGCPGFEPGVSGTGQSPAYSGGGAWSGSEEGNRTCSFTLYRVESDRKIRVTDSALGAADSPSINVTGGTSTGRIAVAPVAGQTAGAPFTVTIYTLDGYGNRTSGHSGSVTTLSSAAGLTASPGGYAPVLPSHSWRGDESAGQAVLTVISYNQYDGARLKVSDPVLGEATSNSFNVAGAAVAGYVLSGPDSVRIKTKTAYAAAAKDQWGNTLSNYWGTAGLSCSDDDALFQSPVAFNAGSAAMDIVFYHWGFCSIVLRELSNHAVQGTMKISVNQSPMPSRFAVTMPASVKGGTAFAASVAALDSEGNVIPEYQRSVSLSVRSPAVISPGQVRLSSGSWQGSLSISGETLATGITVSDGEVTTANASFTNVSVTDPYKARTYPTLFVPRNGPLRIRYYLREDRTVHVKIYNAAMDPVREISAGSGGAGGRAGLNVVEWDGRSDNGTTGRSGGYHILIDKGYEKEWTGAVIKNY